MAKPPQDTGSTPEDTLLETFFEAARDDAHKPPSEDLEMRLLAQAAQVQRSLAHGRATERPLWRRVWDELGGWPTAAGLATAVLVGVWLGGAAPAALDGVLEGVGLTTLAMDSYFPDYDTLLEEI